MSAMKLSGGPVCEACCRSVPPGFLRGPWNGLDQTITSHQSQPFSEAMMDFVRCVSRSSRFVSPAKPCVVSCLHTHFIVS